MKYALRSLLDDLDRVNSVYDEVTDTEVRDQMHECVFRGFIVYAPDYLPQQEFGMYSAVGNKMVREALARFLSHADLAAALVQLKTPEERLEAFQDEAILSAEGSSFDDYFGYQDELSVA